MTSRERVEAAIEHRHPDRTPVFEYVLLSPLADEFLGRRYLGQRAEWPSMVAELGWKEAVRQSAVDQLELALLLGHDLMYVCPNPAEARPQSRAVSAAPAVSDDPVVRMHARNEAAAQANGTSPQQFLVYEILREEMHRRDVDLPILAPAYGHGVWTDTDLMETMLLAPAVAHRHFELATERSLIRIDGYLDRGVDQIGIGGDFAGNRLLISPASYREFIVPEVRKLADAIHARDAYAVTASDGDLWPVLDDVLFAADVDGYLEIDLHAGMTMDRLKPICRGRVCLYGNLDCGNTLSFALPEEVRRATLACLQAGFGDGGHILCASNAITASVPMANYLAVVNAYRDLFSLPRFVI